MTAEQRHVIPDSIHTNGATPNPWWSNAVVYQIYPRSFQDSNGDGYGDLPGVTSRLEYLAQLGVDAIWLSPVYKSPQDDNGYDISDYQRIDPMFGTLQDMDELLGKAHELGLKIIMDLVVNHTSDEHEWFQSSRDKNSSYADWYWWRPAKKGTVPGAPGSEPNQWGGSFGGSAWQYDPKRGEYYLHTFSVKQPDLNWENPAVRHAIYTMMNWWLDRGVDGFRMDVITLISKQIDKLGYLPGESGSSIDDLPVGEEGYSSPWPFSMDGPRLDEYLQEMRQAVFADRSGTITVGEGQGISSSRNEEVTDPAHHELDMLFLFDHVGIDQNGAKWNIGPLQLPALKKTMAQQQLAVRDAGWASLYFNNHDQPRALSRWGDTSTSQLRIKSAKALGLLLHMHRGTPYIYQGEELGMTNAGFTRLEQYQDLESINAFRQRVEESHVQTAQSMMDSLAKVSRDNSRTPMQWDNSRYAGFCDQNSAKSPWLEINGNKETINAACETQDPQSVFSFYRRLIQLRHTNDVVAAGDFRLIDAEDQQIYAFIRSLHQERLLVVVNVSTQDARLSKDITDLVDMHFDTSRVLISNEDTCPLKRQMDAKVIHPWVAFVYHLNNHD